MFNQLHMINDQDFNLTNKTNIILLPNKLEAKSMGETFSTIISYTM